MQTAEALLEIIHERGKRGLPLERLYRHLFNPELYLRAYGKIYRNDGAMTPGVDAETVDGMSLKKIQAIIEAAVRALPVDPGAAHLHRQEELVEEASAGIADMVGQAAARGDPFPVGGVLRAAVLRPLPRVPPRTRVSHRPVGDPASVARNGVVHRYVVGSPVVRG